MEIYSGQYAGRFAQAFQVDMARDIVTWTERNPIMANDDWRVDAYTDTGEPNGDCFVLAIPTPAGLVGFFAPTGADADRIRRQL
ncbi:MAG: hypothetical protein ACRDIE_23660 [Chloroflexota bacterium]